MKVRISVLVITYNSSSTVIETLNSILNQTVGPENIELIISDDASTDNSLLLIKSWLQKFGDKFNNAKLLESKTNSGITININNAISKSENDWIKPIAGDDVLSEFALEEYLKECSKSFKKIYVSNYKKFDSTMSINVELEKPFFDKSASAQMRELLIDNTLPAPSLFIHRDVFKLVGMLNEKYPMIEDYPLFVKATEFGFEIGLVDKYCVHYRVDGGVSKSGRVDFCNKRYHESYQSFFWGDVFPRIKLRELTFAQSLDVLDRVLDIQAKNFVIYFGNKNTLASKFAYRIIRSINPRYVIRGALKNECSFG